MNNHKIRIAMVCHFSNAKVRERLPLDSRKLYSFARRILGMSGKGIGYVDVATWDTYMIEQLCKRDDIELHVISAHSGLKKGVCTFDLDGVHYSFVRCDRATLLKRLICSPVLWHKLNPMRPVVRKIVKKIKPDIIALIGAENAYISGTVLGIEGIPLIVKCQTIYNNPDRGKYGEVDAKNAYVEQQIFKDLKYVSVDTEMHEKLFRQVNKTAINFYWNLGNLYPEVNPADKVYDFVNYAMAVSDKKGFYDAVNALVIVHREYPSAKLNLVGGGTADEINHLLSLIDKLGLKDSVTYTPFFEKQEDMFQHIQQSRFALLPCKMDSVASTIRQAMHYELPVICYKTEGTVLLNQEKARVLIAENGDVEDLAAKMLVLLRSEEQAATLCQNAKEWIDETSNDERITQQMVDNFKAVVNHYYKGMPVPEHLLFKTT